MDQPNSTDKSLYQNDPENATEQQLLGPTPRVSSKGERRSDLDESVIDSSTVDVPDWLLRIFPTANIYEGMKSICTEHRDLITRILSMDPSTSPSDEHLIPLDPDCAMCEMIWKPRRFDLDFWSVIDLRQSPINDKFRATQLIISRNWASKEHSTGLSKFGTHAIFSKAARHSEVVRPWSINYASLREKLDQCCRAHGQCRMNQDVNVEGMRVIDCNTRTINPIKSGEKYISLSYVWGDSGTLISTADVGKLPPRVEQTIEDAIMVALRMGFRHLWVDKYCIDQTDHDGKRLQIRNMDTIYRNATLTIVAAAGADANYGLPGVSVRPRAPRHHVRIDNFIVCRRWFLRDLNGILDNIDIPQNELLSQSQWNTRGWTYQEGVLSRRCLVFTDEQVSFSCGVVTVDQGSETQPTLKLSDKRLKCTRWAHNEQICTGAAGFSTGVAMRIGNYSERFLTYREDFLDAFLGILRASERSNPPVYHLWGVPITGGTSAVLEPNPLGRSTSDAFLCSLTLRLTGITERCPKLPSWSWTGWNGWVSSGGSPETDDWKDDEPVCVFVELVDGTILPWSLLEKRKYLKDDPERLSPFLWLDAWVMEVTIRFHESDLRASIMDESDKENYVRIEDYDPSLINQVKCGGCEGVVFLVVITGSLGWKSFHAIVVDVIDNVAQRVGILINAKTLFGTSASREDCRKKVSRQLVRLG